MSKLNSSPSPAPLQQGRNYPLAQSRRSKPATRNVRRPHTLTPTSKAIRQLLFQTGCASLLLASPADAQVYFQATPGTFTGSAQAGSTDAVAAGARANAYGAGAIAIGSNTSASGAHSTALGYATTTSGSGAIAIGQQVVSNGQGALAMGQQSTASGVGSTAVGLYSASFGDGATSMGYFSTAAAAGSLAIGAQVTATGVGSTSVGTYSRVDGAYANALGYLATATGNVSTAVGAGAQSLSSASVALGPFTIAGPGDPTLSVGAVAVGANAVAAGTGAIAIGATAGAAGIGTIALGQQSAAGGPGAVVLGYLSLAAGEALAAGTTASATGSGSVALGGFSRADMAGSTAVGNSTTASGLASTAIGAGAEGRGMRSFAAGVNAIANADSSVAIGETALAQTVGAVAIGQSATAQGGMSVSIGVKNIATGDGAVAIGDPNIATGSGALAVGRNNTANGNGALALGDTNTASGNAALALGGNSVANSNGAIALGRQATVTALSSLALGSQASAGAANSVALGAGSAATRGAQTAYNAALLAPGASNSAGEVNIGNRQITGLAPGSADTDAVNVQQLKTVDARVSALQSGALQWDPTANGGTGAFSASSSGAPSKITNVADGNIGSGSTDAVNGGQLFNALGNTSASYAAGNGAGTRYSRTNDTGLPADDAHASAQGATAVGYMASASGLSSLALGSQASAGAANSVALGANSAATRGAQTGYNAAFLPAGSSNSLGEVNVGNRQITGVAPGSADTDAVNVLQLKGVSNQVTTLQSNSLQWDPTANGGAGAYSANFGGAPGKITNLANGTQPQDAVTLQQLSGALSSFAATPTQFFHANPQVADIDSVASGSRAVAIGPNTVVNGNNGIGIGYQAQIDTAATGGIAVGTNAKAMATGAIAVGTNAVANKSNSIALGADSTTSVGAQTAYTAPGTTGPQTSAGEINIGNRQLTGLAPGSAGSDAVTVNQLQALTSQVNAAGNNTVTYSNASKTAVTFNPDGAPVTLSNVAPGILSNDAVNVDQLNAGVGSAVAQSNQYTDARVESARNDAYAGIASALAVASLPQPTAPGKSMLALGGGTYQGQTGLALGISTVSDSGRWVLKASATTNSRRQTGAAVGAGYQW